MKRGDDVVEGRREAVNIVGTCNVGVTFSSLPALSCILDGSRHTTGFKSILIRYMVPRMTVIIFSTGVVVVTGSRNVAASRLGVRTVVSMLRCNGIPARLEQWSQHTGVLAGQLSHPIRLDALKKHLMEDLGAAVFTERFPGLIASGVPVGADIAPKGAVFTVFRGGSVIITGVESHENGARLWEKIFAILSKFTDRKDSARSTAQYQAVQRIKRGIRAEECSPWETPKRARTGAAAAAAADDDDDVLLSILGESV